MLKNPPKEKPKREPSMSYDDGDDTNALPSASPPIASTPDLLSRRSPMLVHTTSASDAAPRAKSRYVEDF